MTYFTTTQFGKGQWTGRSLTTYGKYIDELVRISDDEEYGGQGVGQWRICRREVKLMSRTGDQRILSPQPSREESYYSSSTR